MDRRRRFGACGGIALISAVLIFANGFVPALAGAADGLTPRRAHVRQAITAIGAGQSATAVHVKFVEGSGVTLAKEAFVAGSGSLPGLASTLSAYSVASATPLFSEAPAASRAAKSALEAATGEEMPDLSLWFRLEVAEGTDTFALINALNALPEVEVAYPAPLPAPPPARMAREAAPFAPPTPSYVSQQGYLDPAPGGIDAKYAWTKAGGTGGNVTIVDVEYSFNTTHEDLPVVELIGGALYNEFGDDHGTAVLGELAGINNDYGVTGIAYDATLKFSSPCSDASCSAYNPAGAINTARLATAAGDLILIEQQTGVCNITGTGDEGYGPMEWLPDVYDAIKTATGAGRIVVEAAGNGSVNLDQSACNKIFNRSYRDSGAIIVGAGAPPNYTQKDRSRLSFSCYGSRLDVQGWGWSVVSTGYGDLYQGTGANQWYTNTFSGTSSASPIVTGAAAILASIAKEMGSTVTPSWVRSALAQTGTAQVASQGYPASQKIGPRPNLKNAITKVPTPKASVSPTSINFGTVKSGVPTNPRTITVKNAGASGSFVTVTSVAITGTAAAEFSYDASGCAQPLAKGASCPVTVTLTPTSYGYSKSATLTVSTNDPAKTSGTAVALTGSATPPNMVVSPSSTLNFGNVAHTKSVTKKITVKNTGASDLTVTITPPADAAFTETDTCGGVIIRNASCTVSVVFEPTTAGAYTSGITFTPNYGTAATVTLKGTGK